MSAWTQVPNDAQLPARMDSLVNYFTRLYHFNGVVLLAHRDSIAQVAEKVTGKSFGLLLKELLLNPAGMNNMAIALVIPPDGAC